MSCVVSTFLQGAFDCILLSCQVHISVWICTLSCLNVKELLARNRRHIWSFSDSKGIQTHNHLVQKRTLKYLAKLAKRLSCVLSSCLLWQLSISMLNALCRKVPTTRLNHLVSLAKWLSVRVWLKWLWVQTLYCHLNFRYSAYFEQVVLWHSGCYRV